MLDLISSKFRQHLSLGALADQSGYSCAQFLRMFDSATGKSPLRYLQKHRPDMAREALASKSH